MNTNPDTLAQDEAAFALEIMQMARTIQPDPTFAQTLEQRLTATPLSQKSPYRFIRLMGTIAAGFLLASVVVFTVPPLRTIAQEIINLLTHASGDNALLWMSNPVPPGAQVFKSVEEAEAASGHDFVELKMLPTVHQKGRDFRPPRPVIVYEASVAQLRMMYRYVNLYLWFSQTPSEFFHAEDVVIGESAEVMTVTFNFKGQAVSAQFVRGGWIAGLSTEQDDQAIAQGTAIPTHMTWVNGHRIALIWSAEGMVYMLQSNEEDFFKLTPEKLIEIAESIQ